MPMVSEFDIERIKKEYPKKVGSAIRQIRKRKKITQSELASLTHKDRQYIYKIEKGKVTPNISTILILAKALEVPITDFFEAIDKLK